MESRIDATDRLRREGRWEEASRFRDEKRREFRAAGRKRAEANDAAWEAMIIGYPPLPPPAPTVSQADLDAEMIAAIIAHCPESDLDELDDVTWVYDHIGGEELTATDFPGLGAWSLWNWAHGHQARFYESLWPKVQTALGRRDECLANSKLGEQFACMEREREEWLADLAADPLSAMTKMATKGNNLSLPEAATSGQAQLSAELLARSMVKLAGRRYG